MSKKQYILIYTVPLLSPSSPLYDGVWAAPVGHPHAGFRPLPPAGAGRQEPYEGFERARKAATATFEATGSFPGLRFMAALVRVDGGRAVVCTSRGRKGW